MEPDFVIADEPIQPWMYQCVTSLELAQEVPKELGLTYLFIAHDLSVVRFISDQSAVIYKGVIVEVAETEELFNNPVHPYTSSASICCTDSRSNLGTQEGLESLRS